MKAVPVIFILLLNCAAFSQHKEIDSLEHLINTYKKTDTTLVNLRNDYVGKKLFLTPSDTSWLSYNFNTLKIAEQLGYEKGRALAFDKIGIIYQYILSDPYAALDHYQKSLSIIEENESLSSYKLGVLGNIGTIYYEQQELRKALANFKKLLNHSKLNLTALTNIGNVYADLSLTDSSLYYYRTALEQSRKEQNFLYEANALSSMAILLLRKEKPIEALECIENSIRLAHSHQLEYVRSTVYANAGKVYLAHHNYSKAEDFSLKALHSDSSLDNLFTQRTIWGTLAEVYEKKEDYPMALDAFKKYVKLNDSITSQDRKLEISRREIRFEADKKEAADKAEIARQKMIKQTALFGGGMLLVASAIGLVLYKRRRDALSKKSEAEFRAKVSDTELKALRSQMNPHFIFNSLNSINDFISKNDKVAANNYLVKFAKLMRQTLENSDKKEIILKDDLELLENYLQVEAIRLNNKFNYEIKIDPLIDVENVLVPPLILQPFIENSIWHGIAAKEGNGNIVIEIKKKDDMILYSVDDDGVGRAKVNPLEREPRNSLGMKITGNRIEILNKLKNSTGKISIIDKEQGLYVEVSLPISLAF